MLVAKIESHLTRSLTKISCLICNYYLRGDVIRSTTERCGGHVALDALFAHPKVSNLAVTFGIKQDVVQFQVSVKDHQGIAHAMLSCNLMQRKVH